MITSGPSTQAQQGTLVAASPGPRWLRVGALVAACLFLATIFLTAIRARLPRRIVPAPVLFFTEMARLFPYAATRIIEYRLRAYVCSRRQFSELDVRPYFPVRADDKESRFHRIGFFYRHNRQTLRALERYVIRRVNSGAPAERRIGAISLLSLRLPLPKPGEKASRWKRRPLAQIDRRFRKLWYITPAVRREANCRKLLDGTKTKK